MENKGHPSEPRSNVTKFCGYDPDKYGLDKVSLTILTDEALTPGKPPCLTQRTVGKFLQPLTRELVEVPPRPTIDELPDAVIENMVQKDKAFWVDKPGTNAYTLHDAYYNYGMTSEMVLPTHQDIFPRSYQYDLDCVKYHRQHACDLKLGEDSEPKLLRAQCRDCKNLKPGLTAFQLAWAKDPGQKRWRDYPDLNRNLTTEEIKKYMIEWLVEYFEAYLLDYFACSTKNAKFVMRDSVMGKIISVHSKNEVFICSCKVYPNGVIVGRPFQNEACNWYYKNHPPVKYDCIVRKFSK